MEDTTTESLNENPCGEVPLDETYGVTTPSQPTLSPPATQSFTMGPPPTPIMCSGTIPMSGGWVGYGEPLPPNYREVGTNMINNLDRFGEKELGEKILELNKYLDGLSRESFTRSGWSTYEAIVRIFEELTDYHDE